MAENRVHVSLGISEHFGGTVSRAHVFLCGQVLLCGQKCARWTMLDFPRKRTVVA